MAIQMGFAKIALPSPVGLDLTGFIARDNPCTALRDDLFARCLCLESGPEGAGEPVRRCLIFSLDLLCLDVAWAEAQRLRLAEKAKTSREAVALACTHTHSGPATVEIVGCGQMARSWMDDCLAPALTAAADQALSSLRPAVVTYGSTVVEGASVNRRDHLRAGEKGPADPVVRAIGFHSPEGGRTSPKWALPRRFVNPVARGSAPLARRAAAGDLLGTLVSFACHPVFLCSTVSSADYPGALCRLLEGLLANGGTGGPPVNVEITGQRPVPHGGSPWVVFLNGPCGDVNPAWVHLPTPDDQPTQIADPYGADQALEDMGARLAQAAEKALQESRPINMEPLAWATTRIELPLGPIPTDGELEALAEEEGKKAEDSALDPVERRVAGAMVAWVEWVRGRPWAPGVEVELQAIRAGDLVFVFAPLELFNSLGQSAQRALEPSPTSGKWRMENGEWRVVDGAACSSMAYEGQPPPFSTLNSQFSILLMGCSNGCVGYLPDREAYELGGYEVELAHRFYGYAAAFAPEASERLLAALVALGRSF